MNYNSCLEKIKNDIDKIENGLTLIDRDILLSNLRALYTAVSEIEIVPKNFDIQPSAPQNCEVKSEIIETLGMAPVVDLSILNSLYGDQDEERNNHQNREFVAQNIAQPTITFNDTVTDSHITDMASVISSMGVEDIKSAIGINDKFLIISELFAGEESWYQRSLDELNRFSNIDDAYIFMQENFGDKSDSHAFNLLVTLLERKLS